MIVRRNIALHFTTLVERDRTNPLFSGFTKIKYVFSYFWYYSTYGSYEGFVPEKTPTTTAAARPAKDWCRRCYLAFGFHLEGKGWHKTNVRYYLQYFLLGIAWFLFVTNRKQVFLQIYFTLCRSFFPTKSDSKLTGKFSSHYDHIPPTS